MSHARAARISRRTFSAGLAAAAGGTLLAPPALLRAARAQGRAQMEIREIAPGASVVTGGGGNALVVEGDDGSLLIDCKNHGLGTALRELAESVGVPVAAAINTHHHGDHTGGNPGFTGDLPVYAHAQCAERVRAQVGDRGDDPAPFLPTRKAEAETTLEIAGLRAELRHVGNGHTDNDVFVYFPEANILHGGDLLFHGLHPFIDRSAEATTLGWIRSCEAMLAVCDEKTVVVPGHGEVGDSGMIERQITYFEAVRAAIGEIVDARGPRVAAGRVRLTLFEGMGFERLRGRAMEAVYDEMTEAAAR